MFFLRSYWVGSVSWSVGGLFLACVLKRGSLLMVCRLGGLLTLTSSGCSVDFGPAHFLPLHPLVTYRYRFETLCWTLTLTRTSIFWEYCCCLKMFSHPLFLLSVDHQRWQGTLSHLCRARACPLEMFSGNAILWPGTHGCRTSLCPMATWPQFWGCWISRPLPCCWRLFYRMQQRTFRRPVRTWINPRWWIRAVLLLSFRFLCMHITRLTIKCPPIVFLLDWCEGLAGIGVLLKS